MAEVIKVFIADMADITAIMVIVAGAVGTALSTAMATAFTDPFTDPTTIPMVITGRTSYPP